MSLDTYANLQLEIADYLNRTDLSANIPTFIKLAESKINRDLRIREQEQLSYTSYSTSAATQFIALPDGFIEILSLKIRKESESNNQYTELRYETPMKIHQRYLTQSSNPEYYTLRENIELNCLPNDNYRIRMHYIKKWDIATDSTNWLLTNHPDAYLFGALANAAPFVKDDSRTVFWSTAWDEAMRTLNAVAQRSRDMGRIDSSEYSFSSRSGIGVITGRYNNREF